MTLETVIEEIKKEATEKQKKAIGEAEKEAENIKQDAMDKAERERELFAEETEEILTQLERKELAALQLNMKKDFLNQKKEIIENVFSKAKEIVSGSRKKETILKHLLKQAKKELPDAAYIYCNKNEEKIVRKIAHGLKVGNNIDVLGGIIVENKAKTVRVNLTYETFFDKVFEKEMRSLSKKVFGE